MMRLHFLTINTNNIIVDKSFGVVLSYNITVSSISIILNYIFSCFYDEL